MKVSAEVFIHWKKQFDPDAHGFHIWQTDMSQYGYVLVNKQAVEFEVPDDWDPTPVQIDMLQKEIQKAEKEFSDRVMRLKEEISKLQAISYEVAT